MEEKKYPDPIFVNGLFIKMPNPKAPQSILLDVSVKAHDFFKWCQEQGSWMDEKGWLNIQIKKSSKGTIYAELNQWKPTKPNENLTEKQAINNVTSNKIVGRDMTEEEHINMEDIPF